MQHTAEVVAQFLDGETRLIFAAHRDNTVPGLYLLEDNAARELRAFAKVALRCFVPDCPTPEFTTVHRSRGRDGFRHLSGGNFGHSPESTFHVQGKQVIANYLRTKYPGAQVVIEQASDSQRSRVADVMLTGAFGRRIAIEVQYAALSVADWQERHESYRAQDIADVWLFGHFGAQLKLDRESRPLVNATHRAVVNAGLPLLWLNPISGQVATAVEARYFEGGPIAVFAGLDEDKYTTELRVEPLSEVTTDSVLGLTTTAVSALHVNTIAILSARAREAADALERVHQQLRSAEQAEASNAARLAAARALEPAWHASTERMAAIAAFGGSWPDWLQVTTVPALPAPAGQWQLGVWQKHIAGKTAGEVLSVVEMVATLRTAVITRGLTDQELASAINAWLAEVEKLSSRVKLIPAKWKRYGPPAHWSVADLEAEKRRADIKAEMERRQTAGREQTARIRALDQQRLDKSALPRPGSELAPVERQAEYRCSRCGMKLDPILATRGRHILC